MLSRLLFFLLFLGMLSCRKGHETPESSIKFTGSPTQGKAPLTVYFHNFSEAKFKGWHWDFGDGKSSGLENPTHVYNKPGQYTVGLRGFNSLDTVFQENQDYILVISPTMPHSGFSVSPDKGLAKETIFKFTNFSTGDITAYNWTFGDGISSTEESPTHKYNKAGKYLVKLTVTGPTGLTETSQFTLYVDEVITISKTFPTPFYPTKVQGDCDFRGYGPRVQLQTSVKMPVYGGTQIDKLYLTINFFAQETKSDWSTAQYKKDLLLYEADPGIYVKQWMSAFPTQKYWDYEDTNVSYDYKNSNDFVNFKVMGNTPGDDICGQTLNDTHFYLENLSFKVLIGPIY